jgi:hypothetical protein
MYSFIFIAITLVRFWEIVSANEKLFYLLILFGQLSNALICGALSGPHERYQSRLAWLLPALALILYYQTWLRSLQSHAAASNSKKWAAAERRIKILQGSLTEQNAQAFRSFRSAFAP